MLYSTSYLNLNNISDAVNCDSKLISTYKISLQNEQIEILPHYGSFDDFENFHCMGKIYKIEKNIIFIYENIFSFNLIKLCYFICSMILFKFMKTNFINVFSFHLLNYLILYFNFSFDFIYRTNLKFFSYELILLEVVILSILSHLDLDDFFNNKNLIKISLDKFSQLLNKYYYLFVSLYISRLIYLFLNNPDLKYGLYSEWFISYEYGFIKRGLLGEFLRFLLKFNTFSYLNISIFLIILLNLILFKLIKIYFNNLNEKTISILFSPVFIFFNINLVSTIILPKEILGIISLLLFIRSKSAKLKYLCYIFFIIAVLSHEVNFIFLIPIFFLLETKKEKAFLLGISTLLILLILNFGGDIEKIELICSNNQLLDECYKTIAISNSPTQHFNYATQFISKDYSLIYFIYFVLSLFPLIFFKLTQQISKIFLLTLIVISSLAFLTVDWGRWLYILFSILYILILENKTNKKHSPNSYNKLFLILAYNFLWKVPQWGVDENFYNYIIRINKFSFVLIIFIILGIYSEIFKVKNTIKT